MGARKEICPGNNMRIYFKYIISCSSMLLFLLTAGCATAPKPPLVFKHGADVETLTAGINLSVKTPAGGTGGNGYLLYRKPECFRMVMLTPFGTTALEFNASGNNVVLSIPSRGNAYAGTFADLPERQGLQAWRLMRWAVEGNPLFEPERRGETVRGDLEGSRTLAMYDDQGLLQRKMTEDGNEVLYKEYQSIDGVPFPSVMEVNDANGTRVRITFKEPEINQPLEDDVLSPNLEGLAVLPLSEFRGM